jgi:hypothetical protein
VAQVAQLAARARSLMETVRGKLPPGGSPAERRRQASVLRDIAAPFHTAALRPEWASPIVRAIADGAYAGRDWQALPILADALEDEGCDDVKALTHLRGPGPHARGCWVLDALLGRQ